MSIRVRIVDGTMVALCAARTLPEEGDFYLDDRVHYALGMKFFRDHRSWSRNPSIPDPIEFQIMEQEECLKRGIFPSADCGCKECQPISL